MAMVLVVDDDDDIRDLMALWLRREGHEVVAAATPFTALVVDQPAMPLDVVVLDVDMPGIDGFALMWLMRWNHPDVPVIFVTARAWAIDLAASAGAVCLPKPFTQEQLLGAVRDAQVAGALPARGGGAA